MARNNELHCVDWVDRADIVKEYPYIKIDNENEELYVVIDGERKYLILPYIPDPIDPHAIRILFKNKVKKTIVENGKKKVVEELCYGKFDSTSELYNLFTIQEEIKNRVTWKLHKQDRGRDEERKEIRALGVKKFVDYLSNNWEKWNKTYTNYKKNGDIDSNLPLHKIVEIKYSPKEMLMYSKGNKNGKKYQIDHFNNTTLNNMHYNLRVCFGGENSKREIDKDVGLNNYVLFFDKDEKGEIIERKFDSNGNVLNDNKKYCIISKCNSYELENGQITKTLIYITDKYYNDKEIIDSRIKARAEIVMFVFDTYEEMKKIIDRVRIEKEKVEKLKGKRTDTNILKSKRNKEIANVLQELLTIENIEKKKVFAFAEDERYASNKEKIGLVDVCRTDENGQPLSVGVAKRRQFEEARGVEVGDSIDEKNIIDLFYYDIEKYIKK